MYVGEYIFISIKNYLPSFSISLANIFLFIFHLTWLECFNDIINKPDSLSGTIVTGNVLSTRYGQWKKKVAHILLRPKHNKSLNVRRHNFAVKRPADVWRRESTCRSIAWPAWSPGARYYTWWKNRVPWALPFTGPLTHYEYQSICVIRSVR